MSYLVGIDIGGTFTDCAIVDGAGRLLTTKVPSTPKDFSQGMMDGLALMDAQANLTWFKTLSSGTRLDSFVEETGRYWLGLGLLKKLPAAGTRWTAPQAELAIQNYIAGAK